MSLEWHQHRQYFLHPRSPPINVLALLERAKPPLLIVPIPTVVEVWGSDVSDDMRGFYVAKHSNPVSDGVPVYARLSDGSPNPAGDGSASLFANVTVRLERLNMVWRLVAGSQVFGVCEGQTSYATIKDVYGREAFSSSAVPPSECIGN